MSDCKGHIYEVCVCESKIQKTCIVNKEIVFIIEELQWHLDKKDMELIGVMAQNL